MGEKVEAPEGITGEAPAPLQTSPSNSMTSLHLNNYTLPGVLHFLQVEFRRFESMKNEWEIERVDLKSRVAFLDGERRALDNLKTDLLRRVKMLEYALRQERAKHLTTTTPEASDKEKRTSPEPSISFMIPPASNINKYSTLLNFSKGHGTHRSRDILRSYLQEVNMLTSQLPSRDDSSARPLSPKKSPSNDLTNLESESLSSSSNSYISPTAAESGTSKNLPNPVVSIKESGKENLQLDLPKADTKKTLKVSEKSFQRVMKSSKAYEEKQSKPISMQLGTSPITDTNLASLSLSEEDVEDEAARAKRNTVIRKSTPAGNFETKMWKVKSTIRCHLDSIRTIMFHPKLQYIITGGDEGIARLFYVPDAISPKHDLLPIWIGRGHLGAIISSSYNSTSNRWFTGGYDAAIRVWDLSSKCVGGGVPEAPIYEKCDLSTCTQTLIGHSDIIWDMDCSTADSSLASASSDGTIKIWQVDVKKNGLYQLKSTLKLSKTEPEVPTTVKWCPWAASQVFVGYSNGTVRLWDAETEKVVSVFETKVEGELNGPVNGLALQGDLKVLLATIGKWIRGWNLSGESTHAIQGHIDAISCVDVHPSGMLFATGGHDSSMRLWSFQSKACLQEQTSHRKKFDEGILAVKFAPNDWAREICLSAGADGMVKIYQTETN